MVVIALVFIYKSCDDTSKKSNRNSSYEWYVGGTLHKSKIADWKKASDKNKLATCAGFIAKIDNPTSVTELKKRA